MTGVNTQRVLEGVDASRRAAWAQFYAVRDERDWLDKQLSAAEALAEFFAQALRNSCPRTYEGTVPYTTKEMRRRLLDLGIAGDALNLWDTTASCRPSWET